MDAAKKLRCAMLLWLACGFAPAAAESQPGRGAARPGADVAVSQISAHANCLSDQADNRPSPPSRIKIRDAVYTVELVKNVPAMGEYGASFSGKTCDGKARKEEGCDAQDHIYIEAGRRLEDEQTTVLHELQHALLGTEASDRKTTYHRFIYELSPKLLEVLRENPDLYLYLTASGAKN